MLKGIDLSHHNRFMANHKDINNYDFVIMKASEGKSYRDNFRSMWESFLDPEIFRGYYHYARPEMNSAHDEVLNFVSSIAAADHPYIIALDVEGSALYVPNLDEWCLSWCQEVEKVTGIKPMIYCSAAETKRFKKCAEFGSGLWVAKWSDKKPTKTDIRPWEFWAIWQYTSKGVCSNVRVDENYFNGTKEQFLKYAGGVIDESENSDTNK